MSNVDEIRLSLPGLPTYARVARLAVTGLASRLGFTYDQIEDLRIAIGEVSGVMFDGASGRLTLTCSVSDDALRIETTRVPPGEDLVLTELSQEILQAVVDQFDIDHGGGRIDITKRRTP